MTIPRVEEIFGAEPSLTAGAPRDFQHTGHGLYRLSLPTLGLEFSVDRLRRKWGELVGELSVRADMAGARTVDGVLSVADFNLSSLRSRQERAKYLAKRARTTSDEFDWDGLLEEFVQRVLTAERAGQPAVMLRDVDRPSPDQIVDVDGLPFLMRHAMVWFGDGGTLKSYLGLYAGGRLEQQHGVRVGLFDWELAADDHRDRIERLFGTDMPGIRYVRCDRPLVHEIDRLVRVVRDEALDYVIFDSIAFACDGPPEAAEVASKYFQAVRQLGIIGSLHIAHTTKGEHADKKPFGSVFWHNGARSTWFLKLAEAVPGGDQLTVGLYNRKANLGGLRPSVGFEITFDEQRTRFRRVDVADVQDLASELPLWQRMKHAVAHRPMTLAALAEDLDAKVASIDKAIQRKKNVFTKVDGQDGVARIALLERRIS